MTYLVPQYFLVFSNYRYTTLNRTRKFSDLLQISYSFSSLRTNLSLNSSRTLDVQCMTYRVWVRMVSEKGVRVGGIGAWLIE